MTRAYVYTISHAPAEPGPEFVARAVRAGASQFNSRVVMVFEGIEGLRSLRRLQPADEAADAAALKMQRDAYKAYRGSGGNASSQRYAIGAMKRNVARGFTFVTEVSVVECASYADAELTDLTILGIAVPVRVVRVSGAQRMAAPSAAPMPAVALYTPLLYTPSEAPDGSSFDELVEELLATSYEPEETSSGLF